jgi:hypothetical protein
MLLPGEPFVYVQDRIGRRAQGCRQATAGIDIWTCENAELRAALCAEYGLKNQLATV